MTRPPIAVLHFLFEALLEYKLTMTGEFIGACYLQEAARAQLLWKVAGGERGPDEAECPEGFFYYIKELLENGELGLDEEGEPAIAWASKRLHTIFGMGHSPFSADDAENEKHAASVYESAYGTGPSKWPAYSFR
jgi:hypothetical protein